MKPELWSEIFTGMHPFATEMLEKHFGRKLGELTMKDIKSFFLSHEQEIRDTFDSKHKLFYFQGVKMEQICPVCKGESVDSKVFCEKCGSTGKTLTPAGNEFMNFVYQHLPS